MCGPTLPLNLEVEKIVGKSTLETLKVLSNILEKSLRKTELQIGFLTQHI